MHPDPPTPLPVFAQHFAEQREMILASWRAAVESDPLLTTASVLSRAQFEDHVPAVLDKLVEALRGTALSATYGSGNQNAEHGLHRWQQGYRLEELVREWGVLQNCLAGEIESCAAAQSGTLPAGYGAMAGRRIAFLVNAALSESVSQYVESQRMEAAGHVRDLEGTLRVLRESERNRATHWRQAAHDLRGNVGVVKSTAELLDDPGTPEALREDVALLKQSVTSLESMLTDMLDLARLDSGSEKLRLEPIDAAALLGDLCASAQPLAESRGLVLRADGIRPLPVSCDAAKLRRIAQNLLLNALKYTARGEVGLSWRTEKGDRWSLEIRDTGPGISAYGAPIVGELQKGTAFVRHSDGEPSAPPPTASGAVLPPGEGVGLSIVKRLCELLDGSLELESTPGEGTTWRVLLPLGTA